MDKSLTNNKPSYYICSLIVLFCMFGFRFLPVIEPLTEVGMQVAGVFIGMLIGWCTVGILWPSIVGIIAVGFTGFTTPLGAMQTAVGNTNVLYVLFLFIFLGFLRHSGVIDWFAGKLLGIPAVQGRPWVLSIVLMQFAFIAAALVDPFSVALIMWEVFYKIAGLAGAKGENAFVRFNIAGIVLAANIGAGVFYFKFPFIMIASTYATFTSTAIDPVKWMIFFFVLGQSSVWLMFLTGRFIIKPETTAFAKISVADAATDKAMTAYQKVVVATLAVYMVLMLLPSFLPNLAISAVLTALSNFGITALACVFLAFWNFKDGISLNEAAKSSFTWDIFFIVAAAIYIASVLTNEATGIMAAVNMYLMPVLSNTSAILFVVTIVTLVGILTGLMNSMVLQLLCSQLAYTAAIAMGLNHFAVAYTVIFVACFAFITPAGSSLAPLYHGRVEWMGTSVNAVKYGVLISAIGIIVSLTIGMPLGYLLY